MLSFLNIVTKIQTLNFIPHVTGANLNQVNDIGTSTVTF